MPSVPADTPESPYVPDTGDIIWLDFDPEAGREQSGRRPAFVLSPARYNSRVGLSLVCPVTSRVKGYPFEVAIPEGHPVTGVILSDQVRSLDWRARHADFVCVVPTEVAARVAAKVRSLLPPSDDTA